MKADPLIMRLTASWCVMCNSNAKSLSHLFMHYPFASRFWYILLEAFGWSVNYDHLAFVWREPILLFEEDSLVASYPYVLLASMRRAEWCILFF